MYNLNWLSAKIALGSSTLKGQWIFFIRSPGVPLTYLGKVIKSGAIWNKNKLIKIASYSNCNLSAGVTNYVHSAICNVQTSNTKYKKKWDFFLFIQVKPADTMLAKFYTGRAGAKTFFVEFLFWVWLVHMYKLSGVSYFSISATSLIKRA